LIFNFDLTKEESKMKTKKIQKQLILSPELLAIAEDVAKHYGLSFSELVRLLVASEYRRIKEAQS
jgi:antitoxin component of RelBE/YafQ-DinJ toxin-antitoxin module